MTVLPHDSKLLTVLQTANKRLADCNFFGSSELSLMAAGGQHARCRMPEASRHSQKNECKTQAQKWNGNFLSHECASGCVFDSRKKEMTFDNHHDAPCKDAVHGCVWPAECRQHVADESMEASIVPY